MECEQVDRACPFASVVGRCRRIARTLDQGGACTRLASATPASILNGRARIWITEGAFGFKPGERIDIEFGNVGGIGFNFGTPGGVAASTLSGGILRMTRGLDRGGRVVEHGGFRQQRGRWLHRRRGGRQGRAHL